MNSYDKVIEFYEIQKEILNLLNKQSKIINSFVAHDDTNENTYYMFRLHSGYRWFRQKTYKYIQFQRHFTKPHIVTDIQYRAGCNVMFKTKEDAEEFGKRFFNSKVRRPSAFSHADWQIVKVSNRVLKSQSLKEFIDDEYGKFIV